MSCNDLHNRMNLFAEYSHFGNVAFSWHAIIMNFFSLNEIEHASQCVPTAPAPRLEAIINVIEN